VCLAIDDIGILAVLQPFGKFCGHLGYFMVIWYIFPCFGMLYKEKSGNPGRHHKFNLFAQPMMTISWYEFIRVTR
jgi:hypothetical protein